VLSKYWATLLFDLDFRWA